MRMTSLRPVAAAAVVLAAACDDAAGPDADLLEGSQQARIAEVPAVACPRDIGSYFLCLRDGFAIDPAVDDSAFHITILLPVFERPPDPSWWLMRVHVEDEIVAEQVGRLATEGMGPGVPSIRDTVPVGWLPAEHPTVVLELILAQGDDPRFLTRIADTTFVWPGTASEPDGPALE